MDNQKRFDWWMAQCQTFLQAYLTRPTDASAASLNEIMRQYRQWVEAGGKPPRFFTSADLGR